MKGAPLNFVITSASIFRQFSNSLSQRVNLIAFPLISYYLMISVALPNFKDFHEAETYHGENHVIL